MAVTLGIELLGIKFANPFLLASTPASRAKRWRQAARSGWAGGVTWSGECLKAGHLLTRLYSPGMNIDEKDTWRCQSLAAMPPSFLKGIDSTSIELLGEKVHEAKKAGLPVGANIMLGAESKPWVEAARVAEKAGADFLELNLSCPRWPLGLHFCRDEAITEDIVASVRSTTHLPIVAKLHAWLLPNELRSLAVGVVNAGADAISTTNIFYGVVGVDVNTGLPWAHEIDDQGIERSTPTAFSGPVTKPLGLRAVAEIGSVVDVPIMGMSGITNWQDAVEYMMAGASVVQVGMAAMLFGYGMVHDLINGMESFMAEKGYSHPQDFVGLSRKKVAGFGEHLAPLATTVSRRMIVDEEKCDGCGRCVAGCLATAEGAIKLRRKVARVDHDLCVRCNVCRLVCPQHAIHITDEDGVPALSMGKVT